MTTPPRLEDPATAGSADEAAPLARPSSSDGVREHVHTLVVAVVIALVIRAAIIEPFRIPSGSMLPTLLIGDHLFVNKFVYGVRIPFSERRLPALREPERGDVVVFSVARDGGRIYPADLRRDLPREDFVKRIVGLPGDEIEVREGVVLVNGRPVESDETGEFFVDDDGRELAVRRQRLGERELRVLDDPLARGLERGPTVVEEGRYFMLGDNRDHSNDSRAWGTVRLEEIKGPAFVLYWSWSFNGTWLELLNPATWWSADKRWDRILQPVE